jgi:hypothetical protein
MKSIAREYIILLLLCVFGLWASGVFARDMPDPVLTPGAVRTVDKQEICHTKTVTVRNVPPVIKKQVYKSYHLDGNHTGYCDGPGGCEVDHLISLELGGSNDPKNLWPQPYDGPWNAHMKDKLENTLHKMICDGSIPVGQAQQEIATDWKSAYTRYVK